MKRQKPALVILCLLSAAALAALGQSAPSTPATTAAAGETVMSGNTAPIAKVEVPASIKGIIASIDVIQGQKVKKGDALAHLDDALQKKQVELAAIDAASDLKTREAQNNLDFAKTDYDKIKTVGTDAEKRQKQLLVVQYEIEVQRTLEDQKLKQLKLDQEKLTLERMTIRSPIDGAVLRVNKQAGEQTDENPLAVVVQVDKLNAVFFPHADLFGKIKVGDKVPLDFATDPPIRREGVITSVDPIIEQNLFQVKLTVDNADAKIPAGTSATWTWKPK